MNILVTGGTGYIGSHTAVELINAGHQVTIVDNLVNSRKEVLDNIAKITGREPQAYFFDLASPSELEKIFASENIDAVIHFAGLKAVGESVIQPLKYYRNNIGSTLNLLELMQQYGVQKFVFSSSATVYGSAAVPYVETERTGADITSPYGQTKYMIEQILRDYSLANPSFSVISLRYFNPIGAHPSGLIGENPSGVPNNIMPFITQVAAGKRPKLSIFGGDYDTPDGTCVRDYLHVVDLARGHLAAAEKLTLGFSAINLGSGKGVSVLELVDIFSKTNGVEIPYEITARRPGDLPAFYANPSLAAEKLGWRTELSTADACRDAWKWEKNN